MYWVVHLEGGPRRVNHTAVVIDDFIYSFGGYCSGDDYDYQSIIPIDVHCFNTQTLRWFLVQPKKDDKGQPLRYPEVPFQRYGHTAVAYKDKVYMWGGRNDETCCNILFCFDTRTHRWSKPPVHGTIPGVRDGHSACIVGQYMYIFGGFEEQISQFSWDVHCLDLETMTWRYIVTKESPPSYRDFHTATILLDRMYVFGGRGDRQSPYHTQEEIYCPKIVYLDLKTRVWHTPNTTGSIPVGRRSHSAFVYNGMLYVFGGYNSILEQHFNDLYCFDPMTNRWSLVAAKGETPKARRRQVCLVKDKRMYLFGGTSPLEMIESNVGLSKLWDYNDIHVLDFDPNLRTLSIMSVLENNLNMTCLPQTIKWDINRMTTANSISRPSNSTG